MPDRVEDIFTIKVNKRLIEIEKFFINTGDFRSNMRRITSLGNGKCEVTFSTRQVLTEMKKRDFEIISVSLKKKVYKTETIEVEEKVDPKPKDSPKLPPKNPLEFPRPRLNEELPIRVTSVIDPHNIWAYVKTKESEEFMDQLDKTCQMIGFRQRSFRHPVTINENQIYLARLENDRWYRVQVAKITEEIANVFCIDRGISQEVDIKRIRDLPLKYKDTNMTNIFCIKLWNIKPAGGTSLWTKYAKEVFSLKVNNFADLRALLTSKEEQIYMGRVIIRSSYIEDPLTCDEVITRFDAALYLRKRGVALKAS